MIEATACGTPVIAFRCGSVAEVVEDGVSGFVVETGSWGCRADRKLGSSERPSGVRKSLHNRAHCARLLANISPVRRISCPIDAISKSKRCTQERSFSSQKYIGLWSPAECYPESGHSCQTICQSSRRRKRSQARL